MAAYLQLLIRKGEDDFLLCSDGKRERSYCLQDAEFSRLSIFRSEFLLKPKLHQEHSSVADTFNFYFLDISESFDP